MIGKAVNSYGEIFDIGIEGGRLRCKSEERELIYSDFVFTEKGIVLYPFDNNSILMWVD
jgi:hypothetical protein